MQPLVIRTIKRWYCPNSAGVQVVCVLPMPRGACPTPFIQVMSDEFLGVMAMLNLARYVTRWLMTHYTTVNLLS